MPRVPKGIDGVPARCVELRIDSEGAGKRIDKFLAQRIPDRSRSQIQDLIHAGLVTVGGVPIKPSYRLSAGDVVVAQVAAEETVELEPQPMPLDIVHEDNDVLVVNKPAGLVVHPAPGHEVGTLLNAVLAHVPELAAWEDGYDALTVRPGIVHRLDKETSGLILVAKHQAAQRFLQRQFRKRDVEKVYLALVEGRVQPPEGLIDAAIGRDPQHRRRMAILAQGGREAQTAYRVLDDLPDHSLLEVKPITGRTHQVRVHLAAIGHPVVGDRVYGYRRQRVEIDRQFLHAWKLTIGLPSGERRQFVAPVPDDLRRALESLGGRLPEEAG